MSRKNPRKIPYGNPIFPHKSRPTPKVIEERQAENKVFAQRCKKIFSRVYPQLVPKHYGWSIMIEPDSGDYFIDIDPEVAFQKAIDAHPQALIMEMRLNETGTCGRI